MIILTNVRFIDTSTHRVAIHDRRIYAIDQPEREQGYPVSDVFDANGLLALPAAIDMHVHDRFGESPHKETWPALARASLLGGVTTVAAMPNSAIPLIYDEDIPHRERFIGEQPIQYRYWMGVVDGNSACLESALKHDRIVGGKIYLASTTGNLLLRKRAAITRALDIIRASGKRAAFHCEDEEMLRRGRQQIENPTVAQHCDLPRNSPRPNQVKEEG